MRWYRLARKELRRFCLLLYRVSVCARICLGTSEWSVFRLASCQPVGVWTPHFISSCLSFKDARKINYIPWWHYLFAKKLKVISTDTASTFSVLATPLHYCKWTVFIISFKKSKGSLFIWPTGFHSIRISSAGCFYFFIFFSRKEKKKVFFSCCEHTNSFYVFLGGKYYFNLQGPWIMAGHSNIRQRRRSMLCNN